MKLKDVPCLKGTRFEEQGIDGFAVDQESTFITHEHRDHHPKETSEYLVPVEILNEATQHLFDTYPNHTRFADGYEVVGEITHANQPVPLPIYSFKTSKGKVVIVGDYDESHEVFKVLQREEPDIVMIPVYSKIVKGRLQRTKRTLYKEQRHLLNQLKSRRHWFKGKPTVIGLKHSPKAKHEEGIDHYVDEKLSCYR